MAIRITISLAIMIIGRLQEASFFWFSLNNQDYIFITFAEF